MPHKSVRLGWIVPSINTTAEDELIQMAPSHVGVHFARALVDRSSPLDQQFADMVGQLPQLAKGLAQAGVAVVAFACTSASFFRGRGFDRQLTDRLVEASGVPGVVTATAVAEALSHLHVKRVAVATPYVPWVYEQEASFLEDSGLNVTAIAGLEKTGGTDISGISAEEVQALVKSVDSPAAEGIFISCTDLPTVHLIEKLEDRYGKPIVTSNQATFWACLRLMEAGPVEGYGTLPRSV